MDWIKGSVWSVKAPKFDIRSLLNTLRRPKDTSTKTLCAYQQNKTLYTIKHILMECSVLATAREWHFKADNMRDLFENINMDDVLSLLREAELYLKI